MAYGLLNQKRNGAVIATLFIILLLVSAGAVIAAILNGYKSQWNTVSIWTIVLSSLTLLATLGLYGYYLGTSRSVDKFHEAYDREVQNANDAVKKASTSITTAGKSARQWLNDVRTVASLDKDTLNTIAANAKDAEQAKKALQIQIEKGASVVDPAVIEAAAEVVKAKEEQTKAALKQAAEEEPVQKGFFGGCQRWGTPGKNDDYYYSESKNESVSIADQEAVHRVCGMAKEFQK